MRLHWRAHAARWGDVDYDVDPDGIGNVCLAGAPLWLNHYYARFQRMVYDRLLALVPRPRPGARALDIGCGAGRWCARLVRAGYATTGIDLQEPLIVANAARHPDARFECVAIQDYAPRDRFDLLSSVTVLQHQPYDQQEIALRRLRALSKDGGHLIAMENVRDQGRHVFSRTIAGWCEQFESAGFRVLHTYRYDYSPAARALGSARRVLGPTLRARPAHGVEGTGAGGAMYGVDRALRRVAVSLDTVVEPVLIRARLALPTVHCGFVCRAR
jgi:2-polyprenyl-3-methyl-5-hydroxy-6-metoxy-1,4-benzoquinol methylase